MTATQEKRWEYDAVQVGHTGPNVTIDVTEELIARYATAVRNPNPAYQPDDPPQSPLGKGGSMGVDEAKLAMPTMIFRVAPLRRHEIAANNGFVALERASANSRQTPFAKCDVRWFAPIRAGDSISSFGCVVSKEERRGNKFVTFRVEAKNLRGEKVAEYDYTCIFERALGQKRPPS
ncbi:MAG: MaoC family dehydratase N-terminal domain-containing protein [Chloroflexi bacterium]|nr:MaoC family dehydratase N-terminal domain-containing protein [Chloroflexota bacterium]